MSPPSGPPTVHATAVAVAGAGVLIRGASGSGKSSLALALLAEADAFLVADDRVILAAAGGVVTASAPERLAGLLEVRWVGILPVRHLASAALRLVVDLVPPAEAVRLPGPEARRTELEGVVLDRIGLPSGLSDAALRVRAALCALR